MRWKQITEMPMGNFDVMGVNDEGSFRHRQDRAILGSEKAKAKMRRVMARVPQTLDLVFLDTAFKTDDADEQTAYWESIGGVYAYATIAERIPALPAMSDPNAIMIVLTNNEGFQRVQLSPWIVAHRMGHAMVFSSDFESQFEDANCVLNDLTSFTRDGFMISKAETFYAIGSMKSARDRKLSQAGEFLFEVFAQFVITGKVSFNPVTKEMFDAMRERTKGDFSYVPEVRDIDLTQFAEMVSSAERQLNRQFGRIMSAAEGRVVIL